MSNTVDEFVESLVAATVNKQVQWEAGSAELTAAIEEVYGNADQLFSFLDEEAGAYVVLASYAYYAGEVQSEENIINGTSLLLVDTDDFEVLNEVMDEDLEDASLFTKLYEAIAQ